MSQLWPVLTPILLVDLLNPVLLAFLVYATSTDRPVLNSSSILLGHTAAYFVVGIVLEFALDPILDRLTNPQRIDFYIELTIGSVLLLLAVPSRKDTGKRPDEGKPKLGPASSFVIGAIVNFVGIPFAVPYFAAIGQMMQVDLSRAEVLVVLAIYNLAYALPFASVPILRAALGARARPLLEKVNALMDRISGVLMPILLGAIGLALVADAITYFATGDSLF